MKLFGRNSQVSVNGKTFYGNNIVIDGNNIFVDGLKHGIDDSKRLEVVVKCNVERIESQESITISGHVTGDIKAKGSVNCDNVKGNVEAGGSVNCDDISGDVRAGGSVNCDAVGGTAFADRINMGRLLKHKEF